MSNEVKWFKLMNDMFDDDKIQYIENLPDGDTILIIWIKILCLASKCNSDGDLLITNEIPYTANLMANKFNKSSVQIEYALTVMQKLGMIDIVDDVISVSNWYKYQSVDELAKIREQTRLRVEKYREKKKELQCSVTSSVTVTRKCNDFVLNSNSNSNNIYNKDKINKDCEDIISYLNEKAGTHFKNVEANLKFIRARLKDYSLEDIKRVVDKKVSDWKGTDMQKYICPETLFNATKFEKYVNGLDSVDNKPKLIRREATSEEMNDYLRKIKEREDLMNE